MELSRNAKRKVESTHPSRKFYPKKVENISCPDVFKVGTHKFSDGNEVSIFDVNDYRALNQLIGYAKFLNSEYGDVYYRGEAHIHTSVLPSISRAQNPSRLEQSLNNVVKCSIEDEKFSKVAKLSGFKKYKNSCLIVEAMLQHYGFSTHFIDVVDNHWIALWFGLNQCSTIKKHNIYCQYKRRTINPLDLIMNQDSKDKSKELDIYQYMLLIAVDNNSAPIERGIHVGNDLISINLRSSLPSVFLRPHAQHGLVVMKNRHNTEDPYCISSNVIGIIRLRIDKVALWLGEGSLLSNANLFPSPAYDYGYELLLERKDLFENEFHTIAQYI